MSRDEGWAPFHRRLFSSAMWRGRSSPAKVLLVWVIGRVRHTDTPSTPAGSIDCKMREVCEECDLSENTARRAVADLVAVSFIKVIRSPHGMRITVPGWRDLQVSTETPKNQTNYFRDGDLFSEPQKWDDRSAVFADRIITEKDQKGSAASQQQRVPAPQTLRAESLDGYTETVTAFHDAYRSAYNASPTWSAVTGAQLKRLLNAHGADEVQRRIAVLFSAAPRWITPPFTFNTLVRNFDALVTETKQEVTGRRGGMSPSEIMRARGGR